MTTAPESPAAMTHNNLIITVWGDTPAHQENANALATRLGLEVAEHSPELRLHLGEQGLSLEDYRGIKPGKAPLSIRADFAGGKSDHRRQYGGGKGQPLARALGLRSQASPTIIDATAGMGRDAFVLASLGATVTMLERQGITHALLEDALRRAHQAPHTADIAALMSLYNQSAIEWLPEHCPDNAVVYLDPMYPHRDKSALVKKEMRLFRDLAGDDPDAGDLLQAALNSQAARVVVKRPKGAPCLGDIQTATCVESKNTRYDIYGLKKLS